MSERRGKPSGYVVLSNDLRLGTAQWRGVGIGSLPPEEAARTRPVVAAMTLEQTLAITRLVRTVEIGAEVTKNGLTVEMLTLDIREGGGRGTLRLRSVVDDPAPADAFLAAITLSDDAGTTYEVAAAPWHVGTTGGPAQFFFRPRPPAAASELWISVVRLDPWQPPASVPPPPRPPASAIVGPWRFRAPL